jgi:hypothetical protein
MKLEIEILKQNIKRRDNYKDLLLSVLESLPFPVPLSFLCFMTGIPKPKICKVLKQLQKYYPNKIIKTTIARCTFYKYVNNFKSSSTHLAIVKVKRWKNGIYLNM